MRLLRYTLDLYKDDMGTLKQPGCRDCEDALWHINHSREHDGLKPLKIDQLHEMLRNKTRSGDRATLIPEYK